MSKHHIKNPPTVVRQFFECTYAGAEFSFEFYWYGSKENKIYGCRVYKDDKLHSYIHQGTQDEFSQARPNEPFTPYTKTNDTHDPLGLKNISNE